MKNASRSSQKVVNVQLGRKIVLPSELGNKHVKCCVITHQSCYGLRRQDIKRMAFQWEIRNVLKHSFNQENSEAGKKYFRSFLQRHPVISMRTPEGISAARLKGFI